jgi:poly(3-hydroxybutyrate) depolymerase
MIAGACALHSKAVLLVAVLSMAASGAAAQNKGSTSAQGVTPCVDLVKVPSQRFPNTTTVIASAQLNAASEAKAADPAAGPNGGPVPALPEHCEVFGRMNDRQGMNGQHYAIKFHMRLPVQWNGKFYFEGGGGSNGVVGNAYGNLQGRQPNVALSLGYAVVTQDSGHDNAVNNDPERNGPLTHGFDPQARVDHGYNSYDQVTQMAKTLIRIHYGRSPERSYFVGCSEGGREAMLMSQRFADYFDGILACAPGFRLPKAALFGEVWDTQTLSELAVKMGVYDQHGTPFLNKTFTDEDLELVSSAVLGACDALDDLVDGVIDNFRACTAGLVAKKLTEVTCKGLKRPTCLLPEQVIAIKKIYGGARNSKGEILYSDWAWDRGIGGKVGGAASAEAYNLGWRVWKMGPYNATTNNSINASLGALSVMSVFTTPPTVTPVSNGGPMKALLAINLDRDAAKLDAETRDYPASVSSSFMADSTDLSRFKARHGKLMIVHGVSDPIFSVNDTIHWYEDLNRANQGNAAEFVRMFAVPGMNHCGGGPATDQYDAFAALVNWTEKSQAPDRIVATAGPATPWPGRTRPLCAYPAQARYTGSGSIDNANNFTCR